MAELRFREATLDDASFSADVQTAVFPERPTDPVVERYWWAQPDDTFVIRRWVVRRDGADIGVAYFEHPAWERLQVPHGDVGGEILPVHRERTTLSAMLAEMERRLVAAGAKRVAARANEDDVVRIAAIQGRGFREDRRGRRWLLDLAGNRERIATMTAESRVRMQTEGIRLIRGTSSSRRRTRRRRTSRRSSVGAIACGSTSRRNAYERPTSSACGDPCVPILPGRRPIAHWGGTSWGRHAC